MGRGPEVGRGKAPWKNRGDSSEGRGRYEVKLVAMEARLGETAGDA